jgi:hypothetical protein
MIRCFLYDAYSAWDIHLQKFAFAIRSNFSEGTQVSPALLNLGREIPTLFDRQMAREETQIPDPVIYATETQQKLEELIRFVRSNLTALHEKNKTLYDKKHSHVVFDISQKVLIRNHVLSDKDSGFTAGLAHKWKGPYIVRSCINPIIYALAENMTKKPFTIHVHDIKPYHERENRVIEEPTPVPLIKTRNLRPKQPVNYRNLHLYGRNTQ